MQELIRPNRGSCRRLVKSLMAIFSCHTFMNPAFPLRGSSTTRTLNGRRVMSTSHSALPSDPRTVVNLALCSHS
jgi:hypothetical protein